MAKKKAKVIDICPDDEEYRMVCMKCNGRQWEIEPLPRKLFRFICLDCQGTTTGKITFSQDMT